jgi:Zn-dependent oligopeptidase
VLIMRGSLYSVARDFVEAPSQMLENWGWEPKVLKKISSHFETQAHLPDDLIEKLIKRFVSFFKKVVGRVC